jgi:hypothetical protein
MDQVGEYLDTFQISPAGRLGWVAGSADVVAEQALESPGTAIASLREFIRLNEPDTASGDPGPSIRKALALLGDGGSRKLIIVSDFQSTDWSAPLPVVPDGVDLELHRVGTIGREGNFSLHDVRTLPGDGDRIRILASIMNFGREEKSIPLGLTIGSSTISREVSLKPGARTPVAFEVEAPAGSPEASLKLLSQPDPYARDDRISFTASAPPPLNVLALNPDGSLTDANEEIFFIDQALQIASTLEWIQYSVIPAGPEAINPQTLSRIAAVIIPSASASSEAVRWRDIKTYAEEGGLVLVTLGEDAVRALQAMQEGGLTPGDYLGLAGRERFQRHYVGPVPDSSRLSRVFDGPAERDLFLMNIRQYSRIAPAADASVLLQSESEDPLLLDIPVGNGHLVISAFPWDRMASDFPLRPSFLPVVREVMGMALSPGRNLLEDDAPINIPRSESVTTILSPDELAARLRGGRAGVNAPAASGSNGGDAQAGLALAPWFLLAALLVWLAESLLSAGLLRTSNSERGIA